MNIQSINHLQKGYVTNTPETKPISQFPVVTNGSDELSFKAAKPPKKPSKLAEFFAKFYGKYIINSDGVRKFSEWMHKKSPNSDVTQHLQTLGSVITSSVYIKKTLDNESLDKDRRRTLAWNQGLVLGVSTLGAYTLSNVMGDMNKYLEYEYVAKQEEKLAKMAKATADDIAKSKEARELFTKRLKGFRTLLPILTFTLIYRYISPVAITPIANLISDKLSGNNASKNVKQNEAKDNNNNENKVTK